MHKIIIMLYSWSWSLLFLSSFWACIQQDTPGQSVSLTTEAAVDSLLSQRIAPPVGYTRTKAEANSFATWLRALPLKPSGSKVLLFNGKEKTNATVHEAVVNLPIGKRDLHQCADAVMRLRAEYLWKNKKYSEIHFNLTNGFRVDYNRWRKGERVKVTGNRTEWVSGGKASDSYDTFWQYLEFVFTYAGTLSLSKELHPVPVADMQPGDVFIRGGSPGHAVIVVDMAENKKGQKVFLLAQSYMPAQEIHILKNFADRKLSPWYSCEGLEALETPEWDFEKGALKRF